MLKKTLVLGASLNPERYSNIAINRLTNSGIDVIALGLKTGEVAGVPIIKSIVNETQLETNLTVYDDVHTVSLYLNSKRQEAYYDYIISLQPKRVIFNPGTENESFYKILDEHNIFYEAACTLVLLQMRSY
jgi:predicted CoA-binding protein